MPPRQQNVFWQTQKKLSCVSGQTCSAIDMKRCEKIESWIMSSSVDTPLRLLASEEAPRVISRSPSDVTSQWLPGSTRTVLSLSITMQGPEAFRRLDHLSKLPFLFCLRNDPTPFNRWTNWSVNVPTKRWLVTEMNNSKALKMRPVFQEVTTEASPEAPFKKIGTKWKICTFRVALSLFCPNWAMS